MIRLSISVEGPTEEQFVKRVLAGHLRSRDIEPIPILLGRARGSGRGGNVSLERLAADMSRCFWNFDVVTSLVDFYGFRDREGRTVEELEQQILQEVKKKIRCDLDERKVIPYIQLHELEGLLFTDVAAFGNVLGVTGQSIAQLSGVRSQFQTPEDINDGSDTAPSKRIIQIIPTYKKVYDGPLVASTTGLDTTRKECPRLDQWVGQLESLV